MAKYHCLLDSSSIIKRYKKEQGSQVIDHLFNEKDASISLPNICIPEVVATFYTIHLQKKINKQERDELKRIFVEDIQEYSILIYNIHDRNIIKTDEIFDVSFTISPKGKEPINAIDAIVISVALEMKASFKEAYLFTSDTHMKKVAKQMGIIVKDPAKMPALTFNHR